MWVDGAMKTAIPFDDDRAAHFDAADDSAVTGMKLGVRIGQQLDHAPNPHPGCNPGRK